MQSDPINIQRELIKRARNSEESALYKLYSLYADAMLNTAYRIVGCIEDAEDVMQDSFIKAFSNLSQFQEKSTFGAWLKKIVVNKSIDFLKKKKRLDFEQIAEGKSIKEDTFYIDESLKEQKLIIIYNALQQLPDGYRTVFTLFLIEGYDHKEIAQILNIKVSTSISQLSRAKSKLIAVANGQLSTISKVKTSKL